MLLRNKRSVFCEQKISPQFFTRPSIHHQSSRDSAVLYYRAWDKEMAGGSVYTI